MWGWKSSWELHPDLQAQRDWGWPGFLEPHSHTPSDTVPPRTHLLQWGHTPNPWWLIIQILQEPRGILIQITTETRRENTLSVVHCSKQAFKNKTCSMQNARHTLLHHKYCSKLCGAGGSRIISWYRENLLLLSSWRWDPSVNVWNLKELSSFTRLPVILLRNSLKKKKWEGKCQKSVFLKSPLGLIRRLSGKGICHQLWQPELNPCDPHI